MHDFFYNLTTLTCQNYSVNPQKNTTTTPGLQDPQRLTCR